jgi:hypothetical protein
MNQPVQTHSNGTGNLQANIIHYQQQQQPVQQYVAPRAQQFPARVGFQNSLPSGAPPAQNSHFLQHLRQQPSNALPAVLNELQAKLGPSQQHSTAQQQVLQPRAASSWHWQGANGANGHAVNGHAFNGSSSSSLGVQGHAAVPNANNAALMPAAAAAAGYSEGFQQQRLPAQQQQQQPQWQSSSQANNSWQEQQQQQQARHTPTWQQVELQQQQQWQQHLNEQQWIAEEQLEQQQQELEQQQHWLNSDVLESASGAQFVLKQPTGRLEAIPDDVALVDSVESARAVVQQLLHYATNGISWTDKNGNAQYDPPEKVFFACDTEVAGIDVKTQSPVGHGTVICFSIYAHPQADFSAAMSSSSRAGGVVAAAAADVQRSGLVNRIWVDLAGGWAKQQQKQREGAAAAAAAEYQQLLQQQQQASAAVAAEVLQPVEQEVLQVMPDAAAAAAAVAESSNAVEAAAAAQASTAAASMPPEVAVSIGEAAVAASDATAGTKRRSRRKKDTTAAAAAEDAATDALASSNAGRSSSGSSTSRRRRGAAAAAAAAEEEALLIEDVSEEVVSAGSRRRTRRSSRRLTASNSSTSSNGNGGGSVASAADSAAAATAESSSGVQQRQPVVAAAAMDFLGSDLDSSWQIQISSSRPHVGSPIVAAAAAAASASGSRAVAGSIGRPAAASAVYGGEQPAPTVEDIWSDPEASNILEEFRLFFEDPSVQKVWHNYGFDRHVLQRLGFRMQGFGGDTLHMARLWDASRKGSETYALDSLSRDNKVRQGLVLNAWHEGALRPAAV